jgi:hypothetical protein
MPVCERGVDSPKSVLLVDGSCKGICGWYNESPLRLFFWRDQTHTVAGKDDERRRFRLHLHRCEQSEGSSAYGHRRGVHRDCKGYQHFLNSDSSPRAYDY